MCVALLCPQLPLEESEIGDAAGDGVVELFVLCPVAQSVARFMAGTVPSLSRFFCFILRF